MKTKLFIVAILLILIIPVTFLLWYGELTIHKKATSGYSVFYFLNSEDQVNEDNLAALTFVIENLKEKPLDYTVTLHLNNKKFSAQKYQLEAKKTLTIKPDPAILENLTKDTVNQYLVTIKWDQKQETLRKQFKLSNDRP